MHNSTILFYGCFFILGVFISRFTKGLAQQIGNINTIQMKKHIYNEMLIAVFLSRREKDCARHKTKRIKNAIIAVFGGCLACYCFQQYRFPLESLSVFCIFMIWYAVFIIDLHTMTIPNECILALIIPTGILCLLQPDITLTMRIIGFFIISFPMYGLILIIPDCFGGGDVKLIAVCGFLLGWENIVLAGCIAVLLGGMYAGYVCMRGERKKNKYIAFGPFLVIGMAIALMFGNEVIAGYLSLCGL